MRDENKYLQLKLQLNIKFHSNLKTYVQKT